MYTLNIIFCIKQIIKTKRKVEGKLQTFYQNKKNFIGKLILS